MNHHRRTLLAALAAAALLPAAFPAGDAWGQANYPAGPITLVVPFPPGGGTDAASRLIGQAISQDNGWNVIIENRAGAGGNIGLGLVARAKPDGMTIGMGQTSNLAINPTLYPKMPYDGLKDFVPVALVATQGEILVVSADSPYHTLKELVDAARAKPEGLAMGSAGIGTVGHLAGVMFGKQAGIKFLHVPYPGAAPAISNLAGGQIQLYFGTPASVLPLMAAGRLRALAVTSPQRMESAKDVPTIAESGYPGFAAEDWKGLVAPAGTPAAVVDTLNAAVNKALTRKEIQDRFAVDGSTPKGGTPQEFAAFMKSENARWGATVRDSGARMD
jgi:tripartite-type tricarboxylate transporter receptor subunit TctC